MATDLRLRLLAREVELKSYFGSVISEDLEEARRDGESLDVQIILLTALISTGMKASRLLWQYGKRASDHIAEAEAESLRSMLDLDDTSPLAPARIARLAPALRLSTLQLAEAWVPETGNLDLDGTSIPIATLQDAMVELHRRVHALQSRDTGTLLDWQ
jgi:hypothetical protein